MLATFTVGVLFGIAASKEPSLFGNNQLEASSVGNFRMTDDLYDYAKSDKFILDLADSGLDQTVEYRIRGIRVDNLSGSWLFLPDINRYVPPQTIGWQSVVLSPSTRIRVDFSDAPPGGIPSAATGNNPAIEVYGWPVIETSGQNLGPIAATGNLPAIGIDEILRQPSQGNGVVLNAASIIYGLGVVAAEPLTADTHIQWSASGSGAVFEPYFTINPSHPSDTLLFPWPQIVGSLSAGVTTDDASDPFIMLMMYYQNI